MRYFLILSILVSGIQVQSQTDAGKKIIQFSGVVITGDSLEPVPFASVYRESDRRGTFTDYNGFFTLPSMAGDTIHFAYTGLRHVSYVIPADFEGVSLSIVQVMKNDTIALKPVYITPWATAGELRREILSMGESEAMVQKRLFDKLREQDGMVEMGPDGSENFKYAMLQHEARQSAYSTGYVQNSLLNPFAWARFIQMLSRGELNPQ